MDLLVDSLKIVMEMSFRCSVSFPPTYFRNIYLNFIVLILKIEYPINLYTISNNF